MARFSAMKSVLKSNIVVNNNNVADFVPEV